MVASRLIKLLLMPKLRLFLQIVLVALGNQIDMNAYESCVSFFFKFMPPFWNDKLLFSFLYLWGSGELSLVYVIWDLVDYKLACVHVSVIIFMFSFQTSQFSFLHLQKKIILLTLLNSSSIPYLKIFLPHNFRSCVFKHWFYFSF